MRTLAIASGIVTGIAVALALASPAATDRARPVAEAAARPSDEAPDGLLVLAVLDPERAVVANPRTGRKRERELPGGTLCHGPVLASRDRVILGGTRGGRPVTLSLPLTLRGRARSLGSADTFAASPRPGRLWLVRWTQLGRTTARITVREAGLSGGAASITARRLPRWSTLEAVLDDGFLVTTVRGLALLHGHSRSVFRSAWLVAAGRSRFARCRGRCRRVIVWSRASERILDTPGRLRAYLGGRAAFSPDERRLALWLQGRGGARIGVVDLDDGEWTFIGGARRVGYEPLAWSPSGRWLYFTGARGRLLAWRLGASRPVRLPIHPGGTVLSIATTTTPR
jgi:hypothetical protein